MSAGAEVLSQEYKLYCIMNCNIIFSCCNMSMRSWFQTFAVFWMLYASLWVIPRRLNFMCRRFGTLCLFQLHRWCKRRVTGRKPKTVVLTEGGNLCKSANRHHSVSLAIPAVTLSFGSVTDTWSYNWDCAYTNDFPSRLKTPKWANWGPLLKRQ